MMKIIVNLITALFVCLLGLENLVYGYDPYRDFLYRHTMMVNDNLVIDELSLFHLYCITKLYREFNTP